MLTSLRDLSKDSFEYVRISLAENLLSLAPIIGKPKTNSHILPIFKMLLEDESSDVRLALFNQLSSLNKVIGIDNLE